MTSDYYRRAFRDGYEKEPNIWNEILDTLSAREEQVKRLVEAINSVREDLGSVHSSLGLDPSVRAHRAIESLEAAIAAAENPKPEKGE